MCECKNECRTDHVAGLCPDRMIDSQLNQDIDRILDEIAQGQNSGAPCNEGLGRLVVGLEMARDEIKDLKKRVDVLADALHDLAKFLMDRTTDETDETLREAG